MSSSRSLLNIHCRINSYLPCLKKQSNNYVICSDSKSALQAIQNKQLDNPGILDVLIKYFYLHEYKDIVFCWIPGHAGIEGNEKADLAAKRALTKEITDFTIPYTDFKMTIKSFIMSCWQRQWNECNNNKLHSILPCIQNKIPSRFNTRKDQGIYHRCLIGHSRLTPFSQWTGTGMPELSVPPNNQTYFIRLHPLTTRRGPSSEVALWASNLWVPGSIPGRA